MYQIIKNNKHLETVLKENAFLGNIFKENGITGRRLRGTVQCLDKYYGDDRDTEADMGGFAVILYGTQKEVMESHCLLMNKYHLNEDEYEYEELYQVPEYAVKVIFRLYICSNDYSIEEIMLEKKNKKVFDNK